MQATRSIRHCDAGGIVTATEAGCESLGFATGAVALGEFRCSPDHPNFREAGRIRNFVVAFPRTAVWIHREGERPFVADPGVATVYSPRQAYERFAISREGDHSDWFAVAEPIARDIVRQHSPADAEQERVFRHACASVSGRLYYAQRRLFGLMADPSSDRAEVEERAIDVVAEVVRSAYGSGTPLVHGRRPAPRARARELAEGAKELLMESLMENLGVSEVASRLQVSVFHLCRTFRAMTGMSLHEYRREMRVRTSLGLTAAFRGSLSALAVELGFYSHSHFTAAFRRAFGTVPSTPASRGRSPNEAALAARRCRGGRR